MKKNLKLKYSRLTPIIKTLRSCKIGDRKRWFIDVLCDCGIKKTVNASDLHYGKIKSCGCLYRENSVKTINEYNKKVAEGKIKPKTIHGDTGTQFNNIWKAMNSRCYSKTNHKYPRYGGRGIRVEWDNYQSFKKDMYQSYLKHVSKFGKKNTSIDRKDNNKNYSYLNCKWSTPKEQANNTSRNRIITYKGKSMNVTQWSEHLGIKRSTLSNRINIQKITDLDSVFRI